MELDRLSGIRRKAVAGVLGAVLMFAMLFSVGTGFFIFINNSNLVYNQALTLRTNGVQSQLQEQLTISATAAGSGHIVFSVMNTGGVSLVVYQLFILTPGPASVLCSYGTGVTSNPVGCPAGVTNTSPSIPVSVSPGMTTQTLDTQIAYVAGTYVLKVVTQRGSTFSTTYPPTQSTLASQALTSGALGDLYLTFQSYNYYTLINTGCPTGTGYSSYCLETTSPQSGKAFAVPTATMGGKQIAFSITLTNLNPQQKDAILDQYTLIYADVFYGGSHVNYYSWYAVNAGTESGGLVPILSKYSPVVLPYNTPVTVYFASSNCVNAASGPSGSGCTNSFGGGVTCSTTGNGLCSPGTVTTVFILSNGWEYTPGTYTISTLLYSQLNFGQNSPFVSTLYY